MSAKTSMFHGSSTLDTSTRDSVIASLTLAVHDLDAQVTSLGYEPAWGTLEVKVEEQSIVEQRFAHVNPRIIPGRTFANVSVRGIRSDGK